MCVCERGRETERVFGKYHQTEFLFYFVVVCESDVCVCACVCVCVCVCVFVYSTPQILFHWPTEY